MSFCFFFAVDAKDGGGDDEAKISELQDLRIGLSLWELRLPAG